VREGVDGVVLGVFVLCEVLFVFFILVGPVAFFGCFYSVVARVYADVSYVVGGYFGGDFLGFAGSGDGVIDEGDLFSSDEMDDDDSVP
jgi:hypothetical protein